MVTTDKALYSCDSMIIATGTKHRRLGIPSEERYRGRGISYCAVCDGPLFKDEKVIVVEGGNSAAIDALHLSNLTSSVKLIHRRDSLRAERALIDDMKRNGVEILFNTEVQEFRGDERVLSIILGVSAFSLRLFSSFTVIYAVEVVGLSTTQWGLLGTIANIVAIVVSIPGGRIANRLGKRVGILLSRVPMVFAPLGYILSSSFLQLGVMRTISGLGSGFSADLYRAQGGPSGRPS